MTINLQSSVTSPQDLKAIILEIKSYVKWFTQNSIKMRVTSAKDDDVPSLSPATVSIIKQSTNQNQLNQEVLDELIKTLEALDTSLPRIVITLSGVPPASLKKTLVAWFREHVETNILVDFRFNSTLLGGMVIQYGSHVYDWSFRRQILSSRQKFAEVLRSV